MSASLDATVRAFTQKTISIRGRRVRRLLMRHFSRFKEIFLVTAENITELVRSIGR